MLDRMGETGTHWETQYLDRSAEQVSWFQREPTRSLELLGLAGLQPPRKPAAHAITENDLVIEG